LEARAGGKIHPQGLKREIAEARRRRG